MTPSLRRRLAPAVLCALLATAAAGLSFGLRAAEDHAVRALWAGLDSGDQRQEAAALWDLSAASPGARARERVLAALRAESPASIGLRISFLRALGAELPPADAAAITSKVLSRFEVADSRWSAGAAYQAGSLITALGEVDQEAPPKILEEAARTIFARIDQPDGCFLYDPAALRELWGRLPPPVTAELRGENLKRVLTADDPTVVFCLGTALAAWDELPPAGAAAAWRRLFELARLPTRPRWVSSVYRGLAGLAARLSPDDAAKAWRMIAGGVEGTDPVGQKLLTSGLPNLGRILPSSAAPAAGAALLPLIREDKRALLSDLLQGAAALGPDLPAATRHAIVERFVAVMRHNPSPPCGAVAAVVGLEELPILLDLVKWPTCAGREPALVQRITQLTGVPFGLPNRFDRWQLAGWARQHGFDPEMPPPLIGGHPDVRDERKDLGGRTFPSPRSFRLVPRPQDDNASKLTPMGPDELLAHFWHEDRRWSSSVAGNTNRLLRRFAALHHEVPAETLEGAARGIFSRIGRPEGCFLDDPEVLQPIWAKLSPAVAAELRARNLKRLLTAGEPSAILCLGVALAAWDDLPPGDAAAAWQRLFLLARFRAGPYEPDWLAEDPSGLAERSARRSLAALATRLSPDGAAEAWRRIATGAADRDRRSQELLAASLPALARKLPPDAASAARRAQRHGFQPERGLPTAEPRISGFPAADPPVERVAEKRPTAAEIQARELSDLQDRQRSIALLLIQVSRALPDLLWLDRLTLTGRMLDIEGRAFHLDAVSGVLDRLDQVSWLAEPVLLDAVDSGDGTYRFSFWTQTSPPIPRPPSPPQPAPRREIPVLQTQIRELLAQSDLPVTRWKAGAATLDIRLAPVSYAGIVRFLSSLSRLPRLVVLTRLTAVSDSRDTRHLTVDLLLETPSAQNGTALRPIREPAASPEAEDEDDLRLPARDPFWDPRAIRGDRPPGPAGLLIDDLRLLGFRKFGGRDYAARVTNSLGETCFLRPGDSLWDGDVLSISPTELVLRQADQDYIVLKPYRKVVKRLPAAGSARRR